LAIMLDSAIKLNLLVLAKRAQSDLAKFNRPMPQGPQLKHVNITASLR